MVLLLVLLLLLLLLVPVLLNLLLFLRCLRLLRLLMRRRLLLLRCLPLVLVRPGRLGWLRERVLHSSHVVYTVPRILSRSLRFINCLLSRGL